jgi:metal-responsive CopG/Arc/MetJ family transcriptional regulator
MEQKVIVLKLNQQQLELLDRTVERGAAPDRVALVRLALREYAARHEQKDAAPSRRGSQ